MLPSLVRRLSRRSWRSSQLMARVLRVSVLELLRCRLPSTFSGELHTRQWSPMRPSRLIMRISRRTTGATLGSAGEAPAFMRAITRPDHAAAARARVRLHVLPPFATHLSASDTRTERSTLSQHLLVFLCELTPDLCRQVFSRTLRLLQVFWVFKSFQSVTEPDAVCTMECIRQRLNPNAKRFTKTLVAQHV